MMLADLLHTYTCFSLYIDLPLLLFAYLSRYVARVSSTVGKTEDMNGQGMKGPTDLCGRTVAFSGWLPCVERLQGTSGQFVGVLSREAVYGSLG